MSFNIGFILMVAVCVLCLLAVLTWIFSLLRICMQRTVNSPAGCQEEGHFIQHPSLFTPSENYEGYLSIQTAWSQGRSLAK